MFFAFSTLVATKILYHGFLIFKNLLNWKTLKLDFKRFQKEMQRLTKMYLQKKTFYCIMIQNVNVVLQTGELQIYVFDTLFSSFTLLTTKTNAFDWSIQF